MEKLGRRFGRAAPSPPSTARSPARRSSASSSRPKGCCVDARRIAVLGDIHGNVLALDAVRDGDQDATSRSDPASPATSCSTARTRREVVGAARARGGRRAGGPGQHGHRRRRLRLRGGLPVARRGSRRDPRGGRLGARALDDDGSTSCAACPRSAGCGSDDAARPGRATPRPDRRRPAWTSASTLGHDRARVAHGCPRHLLRPHPRRRTSASFGLQADRQRRFVPATSSTAIRPRRGRSSTSMARMSATEIKRTVFDTMAVERRALGPRPARRHLPGGHDPHREARPMSDQRPPGRRHRHGRRHGARQRRAEHLGGHGRRTERRPDDHGVRPVAGDVAHRRRSPRPRREPRPRPQGAPAHRPLHHVRPGRGPGGDGRGRPARTAGGRPSPRRPGSSSAPAWAASARSTTTSRSTRREAPTGSARSSSRWASRTSGPARSRSTAGPSDRTSRSCPPARPAVTRSARRGRRSGAGTPR